jgi:hypothetical protein
MEYIVALSDFLPTWEGLNKNYRVIFRAAFASNQKDIVLLN